MAFAALRTQNLIVAANQLLELGPAVVTEVFKNRHGDVLPSI
jgi:hypothetical protein